MNKVAIDRAMKHLQTHPAYNPLRVPTKLMPLTGRFVRFLRGKASNNAKSSERFWKRILRIPFFGAINDVPEMISNYHTIREIFSKLNIAKNARVASIGCGIGSQELLLAEENPNMIVHGVDIAEKHVNIAKKLIETDFKSTKGRATFYKGHFLNTSLNPKTYDLVMTIDALHWEGNFKTALKNMRDLINPKSQSRGILIAYRQKGTKGMDDQSIATLSKTMQPEQIISELKQLGFYNINSMQKGPIAIISAQLK